MMVCQHCGRESADALYCTWCGTGQGSPDRSAGGRRGSRFAAHPNEGVLHASVVTTLFPHLGHHKVNDFRWALLVGAVVVVLLYVAGLVAAAILTGAILVPVVYLLYLYEARVYRDAPIRVLGATLGGGALVGVVVTLLGDALAGPTALIRPTPFGTTFDTTGILLFLVGFPILSEVLKPIPALALSRSDDFPETIDGLVFGVAAGLGFAAAETVLHFAAVITSGQIQSTPGEWIYPLITLTLLMPLLHGSATGLVTAAIWQRGRGSLGSLAAGGMAVAIVGHVAFVLGSSLLNALTPSPLVAILWQLAVLGAVLVAVRMVVHRSLLEEAGDLGLSQTVCPNCDSNVMAASFCPVCGMAMRASPRHPTGITGQGKPTAQAEGA